MSTIWSRWSQVRNYESVRSSTDEEDASLIKEGIKQSNFAPNTASPLRRVIMTVLPWVISLAFGCLSLFLYLGSKPTLCQSPSSCERGWSIDFAPARSSISTEEVWFTSTTDFNRLGELYIPNPSPVNYSGVGPEVDKAWERLAWGAYFIISEEEARQAFIHGLDELYNEQVGGYKIGLDMFHTLHCVDYLRKLMYPEHCPPSKNPMARIHNGHCVEQIRQYIMCAGDISPIPFKFHPATGVGEKSYVYSDVPHTCRNFDKIQSWMLGRFRAADEAMQNIIAHQ